MIQPPSTALVDALTQLQLCRRSDLRRARRRVKTLARELPAFDSVWIDALLQGKHLSPLQARYLETGRAKDLAVGPCVLVDQLGRGPHGDTFLARNRDDQQRCVLKIVTPPAEQLDEVSGRLTRTIDSLQSSANPNVVVPERIIREDKQMTLLSRHVDGIPATELLIRRGRFPANIVRAIARQLVAGLAALEHAGEHHGDVALWNVRLTDGGLAVLVDAGIATCVSPEVIIRPETPPERYDGTAPERIATAQRVTAASDIYALGCLLWHLLAGRPVFTTGDSLSKLAHHQTRPVPDVREWAPDTPDDIAVLLQRMTAIDPDQRPATWTDLATGWGKPTRRDRQRLKRFFAAFRTTVPRMPVAPGSVGLRRSIAVTLSASLLLLMVGYLEIDLRTPLLKIAAPIRDAFSGSDSEVNEPKTQASVAKKEQARRPAATDQRVELPAPDRNGVITLKTVGPYLWNRSIRSTTPVHIRGIGKQPARVLVTGDGGRIDAPQVTLTNLDFDDAKLGESTSLKLRCGRLTVARCRFVRSKFDSSKNNAAILWAAVAKADVRNAVRIENTVFHNHNIALGLVNSPTSIQCEQVLQVRGALLRFYELPPPGRVCSLGLNRITLRASLALIDATIPGADSLGHIAVDARDCVFDLDAKSGALCRLRPAFPGRYPKHLVRFAGEGSLIPPNAVLARDAQDDATAAETVAVEGGLIAGPFEFAGDATADVSSSVITNHRAPRRGNRPPGISLSPR